MEMSPGGGARAVEGACGERVQLLHLMMIMRGELNRQPILEVLRNHVSLETDVSEALTALHEREREALSVVLSEARDLAWQLEPRQESRRPSQGFDLESWLSAVLRGPHDRKWFDERVRVRASRGWSDLPGVAHILVIGRVRYRVTDIAATTSAKLDHGRERIGDALAGLFDLELALMHLDSSVTSDAGGAITEVDPLHALQGEATCNLRNVLGVIETLRATWFTATASTRPNTKTSSGTSTRISKHVHRAKLGSWSSSSARRAPANMPRTERANSLLRAGTTGGGPPS